MSKEFIGLLVILEISVRTVGALQAADKTKVLESNNSDFCGDLSSHELTKQVLIKAWIMDKTTGLSRPDNFIVLVHIKAQSDGNLE